MRQRSVRLQRGSSVIEVLVGMVLLAVGMIAGLGMTKAAQIGTKGGNDLTEAAALAQTGMEEKVGIRYSELVHGESEGRVESDGFIQTWKVMDGTPCSHCASIRVSVEWPDKTGRLHSVDLASVRSEGIVP